MDGRYILKNVSLSVEVRTLFQTNFQLFWLVIDLSLCLSFVYCRFTSDVCCPPFMYISSTQTSNVVFPVCMLAVFIFYRISTFNTNRDACSSLHYMTLHMLYFALTSKVCTLWKCPGHCIGLKPGRWRCPLSNISLLYSHAQTHIIRYISLQNYTIFH